MASSRRSAREGKAGPEVVEAGPRGVTLVWRTDVHLSDETPSGRLDDWRETVLGKLRWVGELARSEKADAVIDGGDLFHFKAPTRNSHDLVRRLLTEVHSGYPCPVYGCVGNHDVRLGNIAYLNESPLSVLYASGAVRPLWGAHEAFFPGPPSVRVVGIEYHGPKYDLSRLSGLRKRGEDRLMVVCHLLASPVTASMYGREDVVHYDFLASLPPDGPDVVAFGHWHKDQGITTLPGGRIVFNVGSLTRGTLSEDDVGRQPKAAVVRFPVGGIPRVEAVPVPIRAASEVFRIREAEERKSRGTAMERLAESFARRMAKPAGRSAVDSLRSVAAGVEPRVVELAIQFLEQDAK